MNIRFSCGQHENSFFKWCQLFKNISKEFRIIKFKIENQIRNMVRLWKNIVEIWLDYGKNNKPMCAENLPKHYEIKNIS